MASILSVRATFDDLRVFDYLALTASYQQVGAIISSPIRILTIKNGMDCDLLISLDGVKDKIIAPANAYHTYDFSTNSAPQGDPMELPSYGAFFVKKEGAAPTRGKLYIEVVTAQSA